ncbi:MAG: mechanosensitive ion channel family protein, partial [Cyclobacteriaceae bacterium]|nr:mechanosensitive ion channel family protein [Cyclobacteriaceae bacterium]
MKIKSIFIHFSIVTFCIVFSGHLLFGQQTVKINLTTPYHSIVNHLKYLQEDNYKPELSALSLYAPEKSLKEKEQLAIKLKQVYDGAGFFIEPDLLPKSSNFIDSLENKQIYYPARKQFPGLYLLKIEGYWYYSESSVNQIVKYHKEVYPMGTDKLLEIMPGTSSEKYLGIYLWQYVGLFMIIILVVFLHKIFSIIIEKVLLTLFTRIGYKNVAHKYLMPVAKPVSILVIFPILMLLIPVLMLPVKVSSFILLGIRVVWPVFAIIFFYRLVDVISIYLARMAEKTESTLDDQLVPLIRKAGKTFVVLVGMLVILDNLDVNITGIIAGLSIGGLAFALAAQDTIKNFFGSLMIFFDRPFQVGDWITSGDVDGTVEEVGFRAT